MIVVAALVLVAGALIWRFVPVPKSAESIVAVHVRRQVLVTLKDQQAFSGVLFDADDDVIVLRDAEAIGVGERGRNAPVDGEILLFRADVAFVQFP